MYVCGDLVVGGCPRHHSYRATHPPARAVRDNSQTTRSISLRIAGQKPAAEMIGRRRRCGAPDRGRESQGWPLVGLRRGRDPSGLGLRPFWPIGPSWGLHRSLRAGRGLSIARAAAERAGGPCCRGGTSSSLVAVRQQLIVTSTTLLVTLPPLPSNTSSIGMHLLAPSPHPPSQAAPVAIDPTLPVTAA